jgi:hypothetical protein
VTPLQITDFAASPASLVISNPTWFNVTVAGGVPPYSYNYTGMPPGCASYDRSSIYCLAREVDQFSVTVTVNDSNGSSVSNTTQFRVTSGYEGPPVIESVVISPNPIPVGKVTEIQVNAVSVSNSTLTFFYFDLPAGCSSFNATPLECLPSEPGSYYIGVEVTDAFGRPVLAHQFLNVTGAAAEGHSNTPAPLPNYALYGVPVAVIILAVLVGLFLFRRPRRPRAPPTAYVPPPQP